MSRRNWKEPVAVKERAGLTLYVKNVDEALRVVDWWPVTLRWRKAVDIMIQAQLGNIPHEDARKPFEEIARENKALIERKSP
ncbi:DUF982 domain-containing protein [Sinorhizobium sp. CCBAU 05631]|uniref:DUF982 domain-containing protein n=1 Tax=Sinorhizobium sp. CCBAU 05631 TaxID=794846 RepID=UPI0012F86F20|nr:DUF982 domain-containing protein [Sinorhizobium sp. CCBAU 05631]